MRSASRRASSSTSGATKRSCKITSASFKARSPRSVIYKYYVVKNDNSVLESPASNIELYLQDAAATNVVLSPFVWDNETLPLPPPTNIRK